MNPDSVKQFQAALEARLKELELETGHVDGGPNSIGDTLRVLLPVTDDGDMVLTEFLVMTWAEDCDLLHIYSTLILEIGPGYEALKEMLLDWNLTCPLGAFGIYRPARQFFHKYSLPLLMDTDPAALAEQAFFLLNLVVAAISERFQEAVQLSGPPFRAEQGQQG